MKHRLALPSCLLSLLLVLGGCATRQPTSDGSADLNQRLARLDAGDQSARSLIGELGKKLESLGGDLRRVQETVAAQGTQLGRDETARKGAAAALAGYIEKSDKRLNEQAVQARDAQAALQRLAAQMSLQNSDTTLAHQAEFADLAERIESLEDQLNELADQTGEAATQAGDLQTALNEKTEATNKRIEQLGQQASEAAGQAGKLQAVLPGIREKTNALDSRLAAMDKRLNEIAQMAQDAFDATGLGQRKIFGKVVESITLTEDKTLFPINSPELGEQDKAQLNALAARLKALGTSYHLQIQGHTDGFGSEDANFELGKARAEVVKHYLNEKWGIPLLRMSVISYGALDAIRSSGKPNRRIVVQVLQ